MGRRWLSALLAVLPLGAFAADPTAKKVVEGNTEFAFSLYKRLASEPGNVFFSPYSISSALAMTAAGARNKTQEQMQSVLHLPGEGKNAGFRTVNAALKSKTGSYDLYVANRLWGEKTFEFEKPYLGLVKDVFGGDLQPMDFRGNHEAARREINGWVEENTNSKIKDLLAPGSLDRFTRLVLTNAVYFKGSWQSRFKKSETKRESFWVKPGTSVNTDFMRQTGSFPYGATDKFHWAELPYEGSSLSMLVILPNQGIDLAEVEKALSRESLASVTASKFRQKLHVVLPRFKVEYTVGLEGPLSAMGMPLAFDDKQADFSGIHAFKTDDDRLFVSKVVHKAFIDVNEEGTEAAAATGVVMVAPTSVARPPTEFRADRPFLYLIRHKDTGTVLFLGRMADPKS